MYFDLHIPMMVMLQQLGFVPSIVLAQHLHTKHSLY